MKKLISVLTCISMIGSMGTFVAFAEDTVTDTQITQSLKYPTSEDYDFCDTGTTYYYDETGERVPLYHDIYYYVTKANGGTYTEYLRNKDGNYIYEYIKIKADKTVDNDKLTATLGDAVQPIGYAVEDGQYFFDYSADINLDDVYAIDGVEKVELAYNIYCETWSVGVYSAKADTWFDEMGMDIETLAGQGLLLSVVTTEEGVTLTEDSFANTGFDIVHVYQNSAESNESWIVYYKNTGVDAFTVFDDKVEEIDGVISSGKSFMMNTSGSSVLAFDEVENTNAVTTTTIAKTTTEPSITGTKITESTTSETTNTTFVYTTDENGNYIDENGNILETTTTTTTTEPTTNMTTMYNPTTTVTNASITTNSQGKIVDENGNVIIENGTSAVMSQTATTTTTTTTTTETTTPENNDDLPQTGMPWARTAEGLAVVLTVGGAIVALKSRKK